MVNQAFVDAYLPDRTVVGQRLHVVGDEPIEIVGVVGNVQHRGLDSRPEPELYLTYAQWPFEERLANVDIVVRTAGDPLDFVPFLTQDVADVHRNAVIDDLMTMDARLASTMAQPRFFAVVLGAFAVGALALAVIGIYGVLSYTVSRRGREIGLRMALGADAGGIRNLIVQQGAALIGVGVVLGLAGAVATTRVLDSMLFGVSVLDLPTLILVPVVLITVALVACYLPARRATRFDPMLALRTE